MLYATGSLGTGIFSTVPSILLLFFCTQIMGIAPIVSGVIAFLPKLWGLFWDPYIGSWSDRAATRFGRRRPFIAAGAATTAIAFVLLFSPPAALTGWAGTVWIATSYAILVTGYAMFAVPYVAIPPEIAALPGDRARLVGWRITVAMLGVLAGAALAPMLVAAYGGNRHGYAMMSIWIGVGAALAMACPLLMMRDRDPARAKAPPPVRTVGTTPYHIAVADPAYRPLLMAYVLLLGGAGMLSAAAPYFITGALGRGEEQIGTALGVMLIVTSLAAPAVARLGHRYGYLHLLKISLVAYLAAAGCVAASVILAAGWSAMLVAFALAGLAFAGLQVMPYMLVTDLIHARVATGITSEGAMTGLWTAAEKLGLATSPLLCGIALALVNGDPHRLAWPVAGATALLFLLSFPLLRAFAAAAPDSIGEARS
ncbi:MAG: MFS transporter [Pseudomonadota bacterium]